MELRQLRYFIKAAELSNFTEAANALYISQSTLSQQIQQLESELEIPLFDRIAKRVRLTEAGRQFLPSAQKTVKDSEDGKQLLKDIAGIKTGTLNIGLTYGLSDLAVRTLVIFSKNYPGVKVNLVFGTSLELLEMLSDGLVDLALSFLPPGETENHESLPLFSASLSLVVHRDSEPAKLKSVDLKKLESLPMVLPVKHFSIRSFLDQICEKKKVRLDIKMEMNNISTLLQLAATGNWYTVLMETSLFDHPQLKAVPITGKDMTRQATITWPMHVYRKKAATEFEKMLKG